MKCPDCDSEIPAGAPSCSSCGAPRPRFCTECGARLPAAAKFCPECGQRASGPDSQAPPAEPLSVPPAGPPDEPSLEHTALQETLAELGRKIETARSEMTGERREVAVLFADLCGYTSISEKLDPEEIGLLVNRLLQELAQAVQRYEGHVDKFIGDAVMALFGAPTAHEDDPDRSVLAALEMLAVMRRHATSTDTPLQLRIGINLGEVVAGTVGSGQGVQYTVMGDAVNVASRLEHHAVPNTILVSETVARRLSPRFEVERLEAVELRGRSEPIQTYRVRALRTGTGPAVEHRTPLVGRETELAALQGFFARVADGSGGTLLVEAEPGTGKSRLVREALARTGGACLVLETGFSAIRLPGQRPALAELFRQALPEEPAGKSAAERALAFLGEEADAYRSGLEGLAHDADPSSPEAPGEAQDASAARQERWLALAALLRKTSAVRPALVWIEDIHWIDEATQEFLAFLAPRISEQAVGLLLTSRPRGPEAWLPTGAERIVLAPLEAAAAEELLSALLVGMKAGQRRELIGRAAGNPLFLEELARAAQEAAAAGRALAALPSSLQGLLVSRFDRLEPPVRLLLQMASVLGQRFPTRLLGRMYRLENSAMGFELVLGALEGGGFLEPELNGEAWHRFHHQLVQEAAYGGLLVRIRKILHESAARLGEEYYAGRLEAEAAFFAHHYWEAGLGKAAAPHLWTAGRKAAERYELPAAERFLSRVSQVLEGEPDLFQGPEQLAEFSQTFGHVLLHRGDLDAAEASFRKLEELARAAGRDDWLARGLEHRGRVAWYRGRLDEARALFEQALEQVPAAEERIAADLHNDLGIVFYSRGSPDDAFAHHGIALRLRERLNDRLGLAKSYANLANMLIDFRDDLDGAEEHYRKTLDLARQAGAREMITGSLNNLGGLAIERGDWKGAMGSFQQAARIEEEIGWSFVGYVTLQNQILCEIALGRIAEALTHLQECLARGDAFLEPLNRVRTRFLFFDAYHPALADERAEGYLAEARRLAQELEVTELEDELALREGRRLAARGDWAAAALAFARAEAAAARLTHPAFELLSRVQRCRAETRAGEEGADRPSVDGAKRAPMAALIRYLNADADAERDPSSGTAADLERAGAEVARLGDVCLERACFERAAHVWRKLGDVTAEEAASARAAAALDALRSGLPEELRPGFTAHPRNEALRSRVIA